MQTCTFPHEVPEKLPIDQLCRFTILESSANVTTKSVIAEQIYPIITPQITSMDIRFTFLETRRINPMEIMDPAKAARIITAELDAIPLLKRKIITRETTSLAPDEIPSTKGPAIGFPKKV